MINKPQTRSQGKNIKLKKDKIHTILKLVAIAAIIMGCIILFGYEPLKSHLASSYHPSYSSKPLHTRLYKPVSYNMSKAKPVTLHQILHARFHSGKIPRVGQIVDPSAHLRLPIGLGVGGDTLMLDAGTMRRGERMGQGNYALAGHHMVDHHVLFGPFYFHAHKGQMVYITDMHHIFAYKIYLRKIIGEHHVNVVNNTKGHPIITLITCNSSETTSKRLEIRGKLTHVYSLNKANNSVKKTLSGKTNNYHVLKGYK